ncbi:antibiotic biosynthesis monooxygenase family protein [Zobellella taiwanensis]|jgi:quinol monooxygenase YgiN|uniref:Antibiotic biosynthesis monooxygenase n=1 Tax=Zobellella taiwanensis TaxID=347535 RepID=A0A2P7QTP0_9GAMM|nr:antibiotic biosynthesis monooxygenase family protein [Zobellella taiwanensis]PSJ41318.1 antibiotic biosynthesis monooxygenase [Zobellella taiwanensis]
MIKVIIERHVAEGLEEVYQETVRRLMQEITDRPGFLKGDAYRDVNHPNHFYVISNWENIGSWERWHDSSERQHMLNELAPFLESDEKCTVLALKVSYEAQPSKYARPTQTYTY